MSFQFAPSELGAGVAVVMNGAGDIPRLRWHHSSSRGARPAMCSSPPSAAVARGSSMQRRRPNKPLQPTRAVAAFAVTGGARLGPRG